MGKRKAPWEYAKPQVSALPDAPAVLAAVKECEPRPISHIELIRHFHLPTELEKPFKKLLKAMVRVGALERLKGKRYLIPLLQVDPSAVEAEKTSDAPGPEAESPSEYPDDPSGDADTGIQPEINRAGSQIRGSLVKQGHLLFVLPLAEGEAGIRNKGLRSQSDRILIPRKYLGKAKPGDTVTVQILEPPHRGKEAVGKVLSGLRREADFSEVSQKFFKEHGLTLGYPRKATHEVTGYAEPLFNGKDGRVDLRQVHIVTIDPSTARDHDDAISLERLEKGQWRLGVHIADVSEYVSEGSALDQEALRRSFTQYLPWTAMPMLPPRLSTDLCSLREGVDRLAFSCFMDVDPRGNLLKYRFVESFIRVAKFYSYEEAQGAKEGGEPHLILLDEFARLLSARRKQDGNLEFSFPEPKVICDSEGVPVDIYPGERLASHGWIEECMLLCNQAAAKYLTANKLPGLFRVHEQPDLDVVSELFATQGGNHHDPELIQAFKALRETKGFLNPAVQRFYAKLLGRDGDPLPPAVQRKILMSMKKALYAPKALGHFALGWLHYAHFTSPIRRYADLWIHRVMKAHLRGRQDFQEEKIESVAVAEEISQREISIMKTERKGMKTAIAWVLQKHIGREFTATITGVEEFGLFVAITQPYGEGMVPVARLGSDFYAKDDATYSLVGKRTKQRFSLGQTMAVRLTRCNPFSGQVDFEPVGGDAGAGKPKPGRSKKAKTSRRKP